jgi:two-component system chemotaxis sensor kinase CheA
VRVEAIDEIVAEFLVESHENLDQLDRDLLALEQNPGSRELLASVFRTIHTIKGTSGFLAFHRLERLTHVGENLLSRLRDGRIALTDERSTALLKLVDAIRGLLADIEQNGGEGEADHCELLATLSALLEDGEADAPAAPQPVPGAPIGEVLVQAGETTPDAVELARMEQGLGDNRPLGSILVDHGAATPTAVEGALEAQGSPHRSVVDCSVRVDVELLDSLMRLVGELVLARNQLVSRLGDAQHTAKDSSLARSAQRLSLVTGELQEQVMKTRMQPVDAVWSKMPRVVPELDRSVLEAIKDPLTHLVRNAVDHGIESPEDRVRAGKAAEGVLTLRAYHEAGQVHLEITEDGAGIDPARIAAKAIERGLIPQTQLATMSHREILNLIFLPGFSTAAQVTNVSGRGVGMDVVKTRIEAIGGSVGVASAVGKGSTFRLAIPLTLAIIPALTIGCAGRRYAVPQVSVLELVRLSGEHARGGIELISGAPVYRLRDMLLPLVRLDEQLGLVPLSEGDGGAEAAAGDELGGFIVVLQAEQQRFGLVVDDVLDTQEIVVKPLGRHLKGIPVYAGATILGDGSVVLILDASTLARRAGVLASGNGVAAVATGAGTEPVDPVLIVEVGHGRRAAIPLDMVTRLEEIQKSAIEHVGGREVVQYRGRILPLIRISALLGGHDEPEGDIEGVQLVVHTRGERSVGFVVERILDIASERAGTRSDIDGRALVGSVVVGDKVVELLDMDSAVLAADPRFYAGAASGAFGCDPSVEEALG